MNQVEPPSPTRSRKLRCNLCGRIAAAHRFDGKCVCGCSAFYVSRLTIFERLAFAFGLFRDADFGGYKTATALLGGPVSLMKQAGAQVRHKENQNG